MQSATLPTSASAVTEHLARGRRRLTLDDPGDLRPGHEPRRRLRRRRLRRTDLRRARRPRRPRRHGRAPSRTPLRQGDSRSSPARVMLASTGLVTLDALHWCSRARRRRPRARAGRDGSARLDASDDRRRPAPPHPGARALRAVRARRRPVADLPQARRPGEARAPSLRRRRDGRDDRGPRPRRRGGVEPSTRSASSKRAAAALYFGAWSGRAECVPMFAAQDRRRIPPHWSRYEGRRGRCSPRRLRTGRPSDR